MPRLPLFGVATALGKGAVNVMRKGIFGIVTAVAAVGLGVVLSAKTQRPAGAVYTMSNAVSGNHILVFDRRVDGALTPAGAVDTGGAGTGGGLGNQSAVVLTDDGRWLLAVNAASNDVTIFEVGRHGLRWMDLAPSGGIQPVSLAVHEDVVYVLNAGSDNISGLRIGRHGRLSPLAGSTRALSGSGTGPAEVAFSPNGRLLVVTEKGTNLIDTFHVGRDDRPGPAQSHVSNGATPFGFAFGKRGQIFVSEAFGGAANASAVSSYETDADGTLDLISGSIPTHQTAACWILVSKGGRFLYTTNTGSGSISGYAIDHDGTLDLLTADGRTGDTQPGSAPIDLASSDDGRFLYSLNSASHAIGVFRIERDGGLATLPFLNGLPAGANGLAAR